MSCLHLASRAARAQDSFQFRVSYDLSLGADTAPSFYFIMGASSIINPITVMRHHLQSTINYTDCICRPNTGRRHRYVRLSIYNRFIFILTDAYSRLTTGSNDTSAALNQSLRDFPNANQPRPRYNISKETAAFGGRVFRGMVFRLSNKTTREYDHNGRESCLFLHDTPAVIRVSLIVPAMTVAGNRALWRINCGCGHCSIGFFMIKSV